MGMAWFVELLLEVSELGGVVVTYGMLRESMLIVMLLKRSSIARARVLFRHIQGVPVKIEETSLVA
jgi:hypothetical protein